MSHHRLYSPRLVFFERKKPLLALLEPADFFKRGAEVGGAGGEEDFVAFDFPGAGSDGEVREFGEVVPSAYG